MWRRDGDAMGRPWCFRWWNGQGISSTPTSEHANPVDYISKACLEGDRSEVEESHPKPRFLQFPTTPLNFELTWSNFWKSYPSQWSAFDGTTALLFSSPKQLSSTPFLLNTNTNTWRCCSTKPLALGEHFERVSRRRIDWKWQESHCKPRFLQFLTTSLNFDIIWSNFWRTWPS